MQLHLAEIATRVTPGKHCALLVDQAGWRVSQRLVVPANARNQPSAADGAKAVMTQKGMATKPAAAVTIQDMPHGTSASHAVPGRGSAG